MVPTKKSLLAGVIAAALTFYSAARLRADDAEDALLYSTPPSVVETSSVMTVESACDGVVASPEELENLYSEPPTESTTGYASAPSDLFTPAPAAEEETLKFEMLYRQQEAAPTVTTSGLEGLVLDGAP